jgi:hypothetical protein
MPHSEAIKELIAAADRARVILWVGGYKRGTSKCAATRLDHALAAVEAEEKPQELNINVAVTDLSQYHQIGGK